MPTPPIRINARFTDDDARRFRELQKLEKRSASDLLREAVREYHARRIKPGRSAYEIAEAHGLIGCFDGPQDGSTRYKQILADSLAKKHDSGR